MASHKMKSSYQKAFKETLDALNHLHGVNFYMDRQYAGTKASANKISDKSKSAKLIAVFETTKHRTAYPFNISMSSPRSLNMSNKDNDAPSRANLKSAEGTFITSANKKDLWNMLAMAANSNFYGDFFEGYNAAMDDNIRYDFVSDQTHMALSLLTKFAFDENSNPDTRAKMRDLWDQCMDDPAGFLNGDRTGFVHYTTQIAGQNGLGDGVYHDEVISQADNMKIRQVMLGYCANITGSEQNIPVDAVKRAYGLDKLVEWMSSSRSMAMKEGFEYTDLFSALPKDDSGMPTTEGLRMLDGLNAMTLYRNCYMLSTSQESVSVGDDIYAVLDDTNILHRKGKESLEIRSKEYLQYASVACYPKYNTEFADIKNAASKRQDSWVKYRIANAVARNVDPYKPFDIPLVRVEYIGDIGKFTDTSDLKFVFPGKNGDEIRMSYRDFTDVQIKSSEKDEVLAKMPFIQAAMRSDTGIKKFEDMITARMTSYCKNPSDYGVDLLGIEIDMFSEQYNSGVADNYHAGGGYMKAHNAIVGTADAYKEHVSVNGPAVQSCDRLIGIPSLHGCMFEFGSIIKHDIKQKDSDVILSMRPDKVQEERMIRDKSVSMTISAKSFREFDLLALKIMEEGSKCKLGPDASYQDVIKTASEQIPQYSMFRATSAFMHGIDAYQNEFDQAVADHDRQKAVQAGMKMNDFLVMTDCYRIRSESEITALRRDIDSAYDGTASDKMLYRPQNDADVQILRILNSRGNVAPSVFQVPEGKGDIVKIAEEALMMDPSVAGELSSEIRKQIFQYDTMDCHVHYDVLKIAEKVGTEYAGRAMSRQNDLADELNNEFESALIK